MAEHKGIQCLNPDCGAVENYKSKGSMKKNHEHLIRYKECKICGTIFSTVEAPIDLVVVHNNHQA